MCKCSCYSCKIKNKVNKFILKFLVRVADDFFEFIDDVYAYAIDYNSKLYKKYRKYL